jgi:hypothetical protein
MMRPGSARPTGRADVDELTVRLVDVLIAAAI